MDEYLKNPIVLFVFYVILVLSRTSVKEILRIVGETAGTLKDGSGKGVTGARATNDRMFRALRQIFDILLDALSEAISSLRTAVQNVIQQFTNQKGNLASRVLGSSMSFILLLTFLYADVELGFQALQSLFPELEVPALFRNIGMGLVASSVATVFACGMMFWDALGHTEFTTLSQMKSFGKGVFIGVVLLTSAFTLCCVLLIAMNRAPVLAQFVEAAEFSPLARGEIHHWASIAQSLIVAPLLVSTFLLYRGIYGVFVLYVAILGVVLFTLNILRLLLLVIKAIMVPGVGDAFAVGFISGIFDIAIVGLGWILGLVLSFAGAFTQVLQHLLDAITLPSIKIWDVIVAVLKSFFPRHPGGPTAPAGGPIPEILERVRDNKDTQYFAE